MWLRTSFLQSGMRSGFLPSADHPRLLPGAGLSVGCRGYLSSLDSLCSCSLRVQQPIVGTLKFQTQILTLQL